ncbi:autophagy protein Apg9-domain-containing protein [Pseudoneurospora amorphoporcata]|uniref:Autophagy-related protein 9 n=1 Tax=Pseudoneurospora amorphoporcata TaxID=241081 RepID=A0AAN6NQK0_9PEZI|nr:autophagy protein Apg9-domain-containing protein [Pseudoneurospora amorphoporcata]
MADGIIARLMSGGRGAHGARSFYEELRGRDNASDVDDRTGLLDEENLNQHFNDYDIENAEGLRLDDSRATVNGRIPRGRAQMPGRPPRPDATTHWGASHDDDGDNDVPASLLVEHYDRGAAPLGSPGKLRSQHAGPRAHPGLSKGRMHRQRPHADQDPPLPLHSNAAPSSILTGAITGNAKKMAEWRWANITNLDSFMQDVYNYYRGSGIWCIVVERALHLIKVAFVAFLLTFLSQCVDFKKIPSNQKLSQVLVPQCTRNMSGLWNIGLWLFAFYFMWKSIQYVLDLRRLTHVRDFYIHLLNIPDEDMQTITWQEVVARIMVLRDQNVRTTRTMTPQNQRWVLGSQSKERLDASDIANRLMRRENYMIAMINKDILDLTIPLPILRNRQLLSQTLEWTLMFSILDFVFDPRGQVNQEFLRSDRRGILSAKLRSRFIFAGVMILILSPFVAGYLIIVYFLEYYNEIQKNPSILSARGYTPLAEWKFREFNELPHLFKRRLDMSHPFASHYIDQFPKAKTSMVAKTVSFIAGSIATILALISVFDPEMFLGFEITHDRTVLFYTAVFGAVWSVARGSVSEDNTVFDPEYALGNVVEYTHYQPEHWKDRWHSADVKAEFEQLYKLKLVIFVEEILSILTTPFVLFLSLPKSADQIIDFFREFTIHVDGLGYVCYFAEFDFKQGSKNQTVAAATAGEGDVRDDYYSTKHGKMEASMYGFINNYARNPKHLPPAIRQQFHPPPIFPGITSPTLAGDLAASRMGRSQRARSKGPAPSRTPRSGAGVAEPSPMASILLDPRHQPPTLPNTMSFNNKGRQFRGGNQGEGHMMGGSMEEDGKGAARNGQQTHDDESEDSRAGLDESTWQVSPTQDLSRENSGRDMDRVVGEEAGNGAGVVHMLYQFNQAHLNRRLGGVR